VSLKFPEYKPFFYSIFSDGEGRIYVQKAPRARKKLGICICDIFDKGGYYLYRATISIFPYDIESGYLYTRFVDEDTGNEFVKRYKIKNWDRIKYSI
jgi:hypothetical protein